MRHWKLQLPGAFLLSLRLSYPDDLPNPTSIHMNSNWHAQMMVDEINKQSERDALLKETHDTLLKMQEDSKKESAIESKRFIIQTVLSVASLIVAAIAAVASIIALL